MIIYLPHLCAFWAAYRFFSYWFSPFSHNRLKQATQPMAHPSSAQNKFLPPSLHLPISLQKWHLASLSVTNLYTGAHTMQRKAGHVPSWKGWGRVLFPVPQQPQKSPRKLSMAHSTWQVQEKSHPSQHESSGPAPMKVSSSLIFQRWLGMGSRPFHLDGGQHRGSDLGSSGFLGQVSTFNSITHAKAILGTQLDLSLMGTSPRAHDFPTPTSPSSSHGNTALF